MYLFFSAFFFRQKLTLRVFFRQKRQQKHRKTPPKSHVGWGISSHWFPKKLPSFSESSEAPNFCRPGDPHRKFISAKNTLGGGGGFEGMCMQCTLFLHLSPLVFFFLFSVFVSCIFPTQVDALVNSPKFARRTLHWAAALSLAFVPVSRSKRS